MNGTLIHAWIGSSLRARRRRACWMLRTAKFTVRRLTMTSAMSRNIRVNRPTFAILSVSRMSGLYSSSARIQVAGKAIADAEDRLDIAWMARIGLNLGAQVADMDVY